MIRILENKKTQIAFRNGQLDNDTNPNKLFVYVGGVGLRINRNWGERCKLNTRFP